MKPIFIHARGEQVDPIKNLRDKAKGLTALDEGYVDYVKGIYVAVFQHQRQILKSGRIGDSIGFSGLLDMTGSVG